MCGRFTQLLSWPELVSVYGIRGKPVPSVRANYNAAPMEDLHVMVLGQGGLTLESMRWGLVPPWAKDLKIGNSLINARIESAPENPTFKNAWKHQRCLVPATGYFEWKELPVRGKPKFLKQPFYITRKDGLPLTFAGLWERWGADLLTFTILTMDAPDAMRDFHDHMPVLLDDAAFDGWLSHGDIVILSDLSLNMWMVPVTLRMNSPRYKEPDCIEPLTLPWAISLWRFDGPAEK